MRVNKFCQVEIFMILSVEQKWGFPNNKLLISIVHFMEIIIRAPYFENIFKKDQILWKLL